MSDLLDNLQPGEAPDVTDEEVAANPQTGIERMQSFEPEPERQEITLTLLLESYGLTAGDEPEKLGAAIVDELGVIPPKYARVLAAAKYPLPGLE